MRTPGAGFTEIFLEKENSLDKFQEVRKNIPNCNL